MLLQNNISLKKYNSFGIDTIARDFYIFSNKDGLSEIVDTYQNQILDSHFILGGGSNILFTAQLLDTVVLKNEIKGYSEEEKKKQLRDFFISFAVSWRVKERPRKAVQSLFMDVHAPAILRVNYIVSHFQEWYDIFNVVTEDKLYIAPEDRIIIF